MGAALRAARPGRRFAEVHDRDTWYDQHVAGEPLSAPLHVADEWFTAETGAPPRPNPSLPSSAPRPSVRVRYVVEQNVEVEAGDAVQARKLARDPANWRAENEPVRVSEITVPHPPRPPLR
jgi:hypothetical protein